MWLYRSDWRLKCKEDVIIWHHNCIYSQRRFRLHGVAPTVPLGPQKIWGMEERLEPFSVGDGDGAPLRPTAL